MSQMLKCFCNSTGCAGREVSKHVFDAHSRLGRAAQARKDLEASERVLKDQDEALSASSSLPPSRYQALFNLGFLVCLFHLFRIFPTSQKFQFNYSFISTSSSLRRLIPIQSSTFQNSIPRRIISDVSNVEMFLQFNGMCGA
jgi:hypothetical protein